MKDKYGWDKITFGKIDWMVLEKASSILPRSATIRMTKYVANKLPVVGYEMERRNKWRDAYRPRFQFLIETAEHTIKCSSLESRTLLQTPDNLREQIIMSITAWVTGERSDGTDLLTPTSEQNFVQKLGWSHFMVGRFHVFLQKYMEQHYKTTSSKKTGITWSTLMITHIWNEISEFQWKQRNKCVHRVNTGLKQSRESENIIATIRDLRKEETPTSLLWKDRQLMTEPANQLLKRPIAHKKGWILSFRVAQKTRDSSRAREEVGMMTNVFHRFLLKRNDGGVQRPPKDGKDQRKIRVGKIIEESH